MSEPLAPGSPRPVRGAALAAAMGLSLAEAMEIIQFFVRLGDLRRSSTTQPGGILYVVRLAGLAIAATTFLVWLFQARRKAETIGGAPQKWSIPWLVLGWVIPVANLWIPRRIVLDIWKASDPERPARRPYALVNVWWICYVAGSVSGDLAASLLPARHTTEAAKVAYVVASAVAIAAAVLACFVIREVSRAQERSHVAEVAGPPVVVPIPDPVRRRQTVLIALLFGGLAVLITGLALIPHSGQSPEKKGYSYGTLNSDPTVTDSTPSRSAGAAQARVPWSSPSAASRPRPTPS